MSIQGSINQAIAVTSAVSTQMKKKQAAEEKAAAQASAPSANAPQIADLDVAEHRAMMALHRAKRAQKAAAEIEARVNQKIQDWEQAHGKKE